MSSFLPFVRQGRDGELWFRTGGPLTERWVETPNPVLEQVRAYYGTSLTPELIERVICMADSGFMRDLTDLIYEACRVDPHFSMCDGKRLRAAASIEPTVVPASGDYIDPALAATYADAVRQQLTWLPNLRQTLLRFNWGHKFGRAASELVWGEVKSPRAPFKWRIEQVNWIHPRRLAFGPDRELRVRDDMWGGYGFEAKGLALRDYPYKFIGFLPQLFNEYPEREGYGVRGLYHSFFRRFGWREQLVLCEVFGRPWKMLGPKDGVSVSKETLDDAAQKIDQAGANATLVRPPGTELDVVQPVQGAGQVHKDVKQEANDEISKLVLGEVRTSDAKPGAIGSQGEEVALEVLSEVKAQDCWNLSDMLTEGIAVNLIKLNFGDENLDHCPRISLPYEPPPNRTEEVERTEKAFSIGVPLLEDEVYERIGFTKPEPGDAVVKKQEPPPMPGLGGPPGAPRPAGATEPTEEPQLSAPPSFEPYARAAHVLELARYASAGERLVRSVVPNPEPPASE